MESSKINLPGSGANPRDTTMLKSFKGLQVPKAMYFPIWKVHDCSLRPLNVVVGVLSDASTCSIGRLYLFFVAVKLKDVNLDIDFWKMDTGN